AFSTHMEKFETMEHAALDGMALKKLTGAPFKFPESMDKLPDNASRSDFTSQAHKLLGINIPKDVESMKDLDFKAGLKEGAPVDENFISLIKNWAVENKVPISTLEKLAPFYNGPLTEYSAKAHGEAKDAADLARMTACNEALIALPEIGSQEKLDEQSKLFKRAIMNYPGVKADEADEIADAMVDGGLTQNPKLARILLAQFAPLAKESSVDGGGDPKGPTVAVDPDLGCPAQMATGLCTSDEHAAWKKRNPGS
ncbi:hypothetical protein LCGC14_1884950, partial [marine sediment metagenome]